MSSSGEVALQKRAIDTHASQGERIPWATSTRWSEFEGAGDIHQPHASSETPSPNSETLPLTEKKPYQHREGVHVAHDYQPTLWTPKHAHRKGGGFTPADTVVEGRTKMIGRANKKGWRHTEETHKVRRKRNRAKRWVEKNL